jgi:hypothetical protein
MPLVKGAKAKTKKGKAENMRILKEEGKPRKQQIAIMLSEAGESKKSKSRGPNKRKTG